LNTLNVFLSIVQSIIH